MSKVKKEAAYRAIKNGLGIYPKPSILFKKRK